MTISFSTIPPNIRTPFLAVEFDNSRAVAGLTAAQNQILVIGQMLAAGNAPPNSPKAVNSGAQAEAYFGRGSMLAEALKALKAADSQTPCYAIGMIEPSSGAKATGTITPVGPATAPGEIDLYIAGRRLPVQVSTGDTAATIGAAIAAAIAADTTIPVTSVADGATGVVTVSSKWKGSTGNYIDLRTSYYDGEVLPPGVTLAIVAMATGSGTPDVASALAAMGDTQYQTVILPFTDATSLTAFEMELERRWGAMVAQEGVGYTAFCGTSSATVTLGTGRNSKQVCLFGGGLSPTPPWIWAAVVGAVDAAESDPARPRQTLPLPGILPPALSARFDRTERNILLGDGVSTYTTARDGSVAIERLVTEYQLNGAGFSDVSYMDVTTMRTLAYLRYTLRSRFAQKYPRHKLARDGTSFAPGQAILTPSVAKSEVFVLFGEWQDVGLVQNFAQFKDELIVEVDSSNVNQLDIQLGPNLLGAFITMAAQMQFIL
jgi:phage tail sheath gpL-like